MSNLTNAFEKVFKDLRTGPYASEAEPAALINPDTRTPEEKCLHTMMDERGAWEQGVDSFSVLRDIALELLAEKTRTSAQPVMPGWMNYNVATNVLMIHGKKYSAAMFGEDGFLAPVGTLLRVEDGPPECVTLNIIKQDAAHQEPVAKFTRWGERGTSGEGYTVQFLGERPLPPDGTLFYTAAQTVPLTVQGYSEAMECEIISADFGDNTITVEMKSKGWKVRAGTYWLGTTLPPIQDNQNHGDI